MIRCVAFDLDGVLIPSTPSFEYFASQLWRVGPYDLAMLGKVDLFEILPPVLERWEWDGTVSDFASAWFHSCATADAKAVEIVRALRHHGVMCYAASNQDNRRATFLDSQLWLQALFDRRFYSCRMGVKKPDAEYFTVIQREAALSPQDMLFVDDKLENVKGARECGWRAEVCRGASDLHEIMVNYFPALPLHESTVSGAS